MIGKAGKKTKKQKNKKTQKTKKEHTMEKSDVPHFFHVVKKKKPKITDRN